MIDLCCHILPGLDGSAPYLDAAARMAEIAVDSGCDVLVTAPISADCSDSMYRVCEGKKLSDSYMTLSSEIQARNIPLQLRSGMLIHASDTSKVLQGLQKGNLYPLEGTRYLMLELSGSHEPDTDDTEGTFDRILGMTQKLCQAGYKPIFAKPEFMDLFIQNPDRCEDIIAEGGFFLGSKSGLLGRVNPETQDALMYMISQGYIAAIASFAVHHEFDTPHMEETLSMIQTAFSDDAAALLMDINPNRFLHDDVPLQY